VGNGGNAADIGEIFGEGGEVFLLVVELVAGLSEPRLLASLDCRKALKIGGLGGTSQLLSAKDVELRLTSCARVERVGLGVNMEWFSELNAS